MRVTKLPIDPGPAGWNCLLAPPEPARRLTEKITADWLVIGGGFAGLAAVRRLSQLHRGDRVVLLEATRFGEGPAGRNSGFMIDLPHDLASDDYGGALDADRAQTRANRAGIDFAGDMAREYDLPKEAYILSGKINGAATEKGHQHNLDYAQHLHRMGEANEMLDAQQMAEITGTTFYRSGLYTPGTAMIQPAMFIRGVGNGLRSDRVQLYENTPVISLTMSNLWNAKTPDGEVSAPKVILAVNGHANSFGFFKHRLMHVFTYASMTRELTLEESKQLGGKPEWGLTPSDPLGTTVRRISGIGGDRIIVRNRFTYDPSMEVDERRITQVGRDHDKAFANRFATLKDVGMEYRWGGRLCLSRNNVAAFGEVEKDLYAACCQNGLGTAKGTLSGMLAAELASGLQSDLLTEFQLQESPSRLPPEPIASIGATAFLRWGEFKAGKEL